MGCHHDEPTGVYGLLSDLYCAAAIACFLYALHRIANGLMLSGEIKRSRGLRMPTRLKSVRRSSTRSRASRSACDN